MRWLKSAPLLPSKEYCRLLFAGNEMHSPGSLKMKMNIHSYYFFLLFSLRCFPKTRNRQRVLWVALTRHDCGMFKEVLEITRKAESPRERSVFRISHSAPHCQTADVSTLRALAACQGTALRPCTQCARVCGDRQKTSAVSSEMDGQIRGKAAEETRPSVDTGMCPNVVSRRQWGAVAPRSQERLQGQALRAVIHHTALWPCHSPGQCRLQVEHIQELHMQGRDFHDIGYNFLICGDGTVYEGRGWGVVGAHAKGNNHDSVGIAFMGNFNNETPTPAALSSTRKLLQCGVALGHLHPRYTLLGHRDLAKTECPGEQLYAALQLLAQR
ncbi:peptidoglycan recognition protein 5 isoform X2 [Megalops cyprinoides]|uniref:peptidoglycan recognition protein 5 isoform X2 n=1 Tax=Megalops cyprinoides TaxID=118141 RepID=UPI00186471D3|nr:peptidoglycan recognition protein 5 isoform X2 [Megalops cyprinoides]